MGFPASDMDKYNVGVYTPAYASPAQLEAYEKLKEGTKKVEAKSNLPVLITTVWLTKMGACNEGVTEFVKRYPNGSVYTADLLVDCYTENKSYFNWLMGILQDKRMVKVR